MLQVLCTKLQMTVEAFQSTEHGVYFMKHAKKKRAKYVGWSTNVHATLLGLIHGLYNIRRSEHNALQKEILCQCPFAKDWSLVAWPCKKENLLLEHAKKVIENNSLYPCGLNELVMYRSKEKWDEFCMWYMAERRGLL